MACDARPAVAAYCAPFYVIRTPGFFGQDLTLAPINVWSGSNGASERLRSLSGFFCFFVLRIDGLHREIEVPRSLQNAPLPGHWIAVHDDNALTLEVGAEAVCLAIVFVRACRLTCL